MKKKEIEQQLERMDALLQENIRLKQTLVEVNELLLSWMRREDWEKYLPAAEELDRALGGISLSA